VLVAADAAVDRVAMTLPRAVAIVTALDTASNVQDADVMLLSGGGMLSIIDKLLTAVEADVGRVNVSSYSHVEAQLRSLRTQSSHL
jgi:predicted NBD/HSP70 family sugar kinase